MTPDVCVVGGGIVGTATAYFAAAAGLRVLLLERSDLAAGASGAAFGGVSASIYSYADVDVPAHYVDLSLESVRLYGELAGELGPPLDFEVCGEIDPFFEDDDVASRRDRVDSLRATGVPVELLDGDDLRELEPALSHEVAGGSWCAIGGSVTPQTAVWSLADSARRNGAEIRTGVKVERVLLEGGRAVGVMTRDGAVRADNVVLCSGAATDALAEAAGIRIPLDFFRRQLFVSERLPPLVRTAIHNIKQTRSGTVVYGLSRKVHGAPRARTNDVTREGVQDLVWSATRTIPALATARPLRFWAGVIIVPGDGYPVLGPVESIRNLFLGVLNRGVTLGPLAGRILASLLLTGRTDRDLTPYAVERFAGLGGPPIEEAYYGH
jgi:glycine/D-amino acid oxidase-like deaminating enzyme